MWDQWIKSWLQQAVRGEIHRAANEPTPESPKQRACDVGVIFALPIEAGGFEDRIDGMLDIGGTPCRMKFGGLKGRHVVIAISGPGRDAAATATDVLIAGHRPRLVISAGFAGGLDDSLTQGDLFLPNELIDTRQASLPVEDRSNLLQIDSGTKIKRGTLLTADRIIGTAKEKRHLGAKYSAQAVEMETLAVATVCRRNETPFLPVRIISDAVDDELPPDLDHLIQQDSAMGRLGAAAGAIFRRPASLKEMWQLKERAIVHSDKLAAYLERLIVTLVPIAKGN